MSKKDIANFFVSNHTVLKIQKELVKTHKPNFSYLPRVLCVDEFKSTSSCKIAMSSICVDGEQNELFEILEDRRLSQQIKHFMRFSRKTRKKLKYLVMDMNASYGQLIQTVFPCAVIVTNRFHIFQHITRFFNQLRVKVMNQFRTGDTKEQKRYHRLKHYWKLFLKDSDKVDTDASIELG
ncbi:transposase [Vagococcus elongatus]